MSFGWVSYLSCSYEESKTIGFNSKAKQAEEDGILFDVTKLNEKWKKGLGYIKYYCQFAAMGVKFGKEV